MERAELINHLEHLADYVKYSEDAPALREVIEMLKTHKKRTETHACDCISRADVEQTVEDNILCYTHSDRPIDQDPDTECHKAIRTALRMLRKDLRKLSPAQPEQRWIPCSERLPEENLPVLVAVKQKDRLPKWVKEQTYSYVTNIDVYDDVDFDTHKNKVVAWMPLPEPYKERREE